MTPSVEVEARRQAIPADTLLRLLTENAVHITAVLEPGGTIRYVSPAIERMLGYPPDALIGTPARALIHPDDRPSNLALDPSGSPIRLSQFRARHKDGSWRLMEAIICNRLDDPLIGGIVVDARDVTERNWSAQRLQHSLEALLAIHQVGLILGSNPEQQAIASAVVECALRIAPIEEAVLLLRTERGSLVSAGAAGGGSIWSALQSARSARAARQHVLKSETAQFFRARPSQLACKSIEAWDVPLRSQERVIGILEVYGSDLRGAGGLDELSILADQAASALERARLYRELAVRERRLEALVRQLLLAEDDERRRVAFDIHDGLAQFAWAAQEHLEAFAATYLRGRARSPQRRTELEQAIGLASQTVREARRVIAGLRPAILDDFGLSSAISVELQNLRAEGCEVAFHDRMGSLRLEPTLETALFRVVQEALTNVRKHARAPRVEVTLERRSTALHLEIRDWGCGFSTNPAQSVNGRGERVGLAGMQERIGLINGRLAIQSRPGMGTCVQVQAPLREAVKA